MACELRGRAFSTRSAVCFPFALQFVLSSHDRNYQTPTLSYYWEDIKIHGKPRTEELLPNAGIVFVTDRGDAVLTFSALGGMNVLMNTYSEHRYSTKR